VRLPSRIGVVVVAVSLIMGGSLLVAPAAWADTGTVNTNTISAGNMPSNVAFSPNGELAITTNPGIGNGNTVSVITVATGAIETLQVGTRPMGVAFSPNGELAYVANQTSSTVSVINVGYDGTLSDVQLTTLGVGAGPTKVAFSPNGELAYVTNSTGVSVSVIAVKYGGLVGVVKSPLSVGKPTLAVAFSPNGTLAYVVNGSGSSYRVSVITVGYGDTLGTVGVNPLTVGNGASAVAFSPNGMLAFVTNYLDDSVSVITVDYDNATGAVASPPLSVGRYPNGVAFSPDGTFAYVINNGGGAQSSVSILTPKYDGTASVVGTTPLNIGGPATGVAFSPDGTLAYVVTEKASANVYVIDIRNTSTSTAATTIVPGARTAALGALTWKTDGEEEAKWSGSNLKFSHTSTNITGTAVLTVDDQSGSGAGWQISLQATEFVFTPVNGGAGTAIAIANTALGVTTAGAITAVHGEDDLDISTEDTQSLGESRTLLNANADQGEGKYTTPLTFTLAVPANTRSGTYTSTLTTTMAVSP
jgi:DNA-binding beta-propeller fold protein YncE